MRVASNLARGSVSFNMTPMIDVVFLLIIFFLVSSNLAQQEVHPEIELPDAASGDQPRHDDTRRIVINVVSKDHVQVGTEIVTPKRLADLIRYESRETKGKLEVRIRADRRVPYGVFEPILMACVQADVWNVSFAVISNK